MLFRSGQIDSTKIRLYFYPDTATQIRPVLASFWLQNWNMNIAANTTATYSATQTKALANSAISIFSVAPHSHHVCTKLRIMPKTEPTPLLSFQ